MIEVINEDYTEDILTLSTVSFKDMEIGVLYKTTSIDTDGNPFDTVYIKSMQNELVWFENPQSNMYADKRIGTGNEHGPFVRAPKGTGVLIVND